MAASPVHSGPATYTGRSRRRRTRWSVRLGDCLAGWIITTGGIGTIVAVLTVVVFLAWVVAPLFVGGRASEPAIAPWRGELPRHWVVADHGLLAWGLFGDGQLRCLRLDGEHAGELLFEQRLCERAELCASALAGNQQELLLAFTDGTLRLARVRFTTRYLAHQEQKRAPPLNPREATVRQQTLLHRTHTGQIRAEGLTIELGPPIARGDAGPLEAVHWVDFLPRTVAPLACTLSQDGRLEVHTLRRLPEGDLHYRAVTQEVGRVPMTPPPSYLLISGVGDDVFVAWEDGRLLRFNRAAEGGPHLAEDVDLVPEPGERLTVLTQLVGKTTLVAGDTLGRVRGWFRVRGGQHEQHASPQQGSVAEAVPASGEGTAVPASGAAQAAGVVAGWGSGDGTSLAAAHNLPGPAEVRAVAASQRSRMLAAGYANGEVRLFYMTTGRMLAHTRAPEARPADWLVLTPQDSALFAGLDGRLCRWTLDIPHPEVSFAGLITPRWYEGYDRPAHVWQSTGGDDFEPKFGFWPLVFGTLKATFYSMLFGAPLALLSAVYTSEFMSQRAKVRVKPVVELMASLPSVVLGFIAALVLAPVVARRLPVIVAWFATLPLCCLLAAYLWQLVPARLRARFQGQRPVLIGLALAAGVALGAILGGWLERLFFAGDIVQWLNGEGAHSLGGWLLLLLPASAAAALFMVVTYLNPRLRGLMSRASQAQAALLELGKFMLAAALTLLAAVAAAWLLERVGLDPRRSFFGTYEQTNSLVVGLMMGFAIVPIIYTLAEDALSAVPAHLRSASLGAGATPWQTAVRIVIPTAASGLFSALMVGLGRAVGETMIVLMAAGGTPVLDINIFNGFRTLSANIAIELPEAVRNSTHYRLLFLTALVLFGMTFVLNTVAELVRQRFRKRAVQL